MKPVWEIGRIQYADSRKYLDAGWEPFAVTESPHQTEKGKQFDTVYTYTVYVYMRRQVMVDDKR